MSKELGSAPCDLCENMAAVITRFAGKSEALCDEPYRQTRGRFVNDDATGLKS